MSGHEIVDHVTAMGGAVTKCAVGDVVGVGVHVGIAGSLIDGFAETQELPDFLQGTQADRRYRDDRHGRYRDRL